MSPGLDHLSIVLNCKAARGYKTKGAGWLQKKVQKNFTSTKNEIELICWVFLLRFLTGHLLENVGLKLLNTETLLLKLSKIKKKSHWNYFHLLCQALSDVLIASLSQGKFIRLQYLISMFAFKRSSSYSKSHCIKQISAKKCIGRHTWTSFLLLVFTVSSRIKSYFFLRWSISGFLFAYFNISVLLF